MSIPETNLNARSLAWRLFREAADEDYLVARWSVSAGLDYQFAWSSQQAIEKYLKCALLLNDVNVKFYGHKLLPMFQALKSLDTGLVPDLYCPPSYFPNQLQTLSGRFELTVDVIRRFDTSGDTNNRYRNYSLASDRFDLHKLDELCFNIRRLTMPLNMMFDETMRYRDALKKFPNLQLHPFKINGSPGDARFDKRNATFLWRNFSYNQEGALEVGKISVGFSSKNSEIYLATKRGEDAMEAIDWVLENAWFSKEDRQFLRTVTSKP